MEMWLAPIKIKKISPYRMLSPIETVCERPTQKKNNECNNYINNNNVRWRLPNTSSTHFSRSSHEPLGWDYQLHLVDTHISFFYIWRATHTLPPEPNNVFVQSDKQFGLEQGIWFYQRRECGQMEWSVYQLIAKGKHTIYLKQTSYQYIRVEVILVFFYITILNITKSLSCCDSKRR